MELICNECEIHTPHYIKLWKKDCCALEQKIVRSYDKKIITIKFNPLVPLIEYLLILEKLGLGNKN